MTAVIRAYFRTYISNLTFKLYQISFDNDCFALRTKKNFLYFHAGIFILFFGFSRRILLIFFVFLANFFSVRKVLDCTVFTEIKMTTRALYLKDVDLDRTISPNCSVSSLGCSNFHEKGVTDIRLLS